MDILQIRLDLLKLCYRSDRRPEEALIAAKVLEDYVFSKKQDEQIVKQEQGTDEVETFTHVDKEHGHKARRGRKPKLGGKH